MSKKSSSSCICKKSTGVNRKLDYQRMFQKIYFYYKRVLKKYNNCRQRKMYGKYNRMYLIERNQKLQTLIERYHRNPRAINSSNVINRNGTTKLKQQYLK